jgi:3-methyl-2-oxobutanoate hydroxymethyltransferase
MLGFNEGHLPKFVKQYARLGEAARAGIRQYAEEVCSGKFPAPEHCY